MKRSLFLCFLSSLAFAGPSLHAATLLAEGVVYNDNGTSGRFYDMGKANNGWAIKDSEAYNWVVQHRDAEGDYRALGNLLELIPESTQKLSSKYTATVLNYLKKDSNLCWAYTSSNILQYWQDSYGVFARSHGSTAAEATDGYTYEPSEFAATGGCQSLNLGFHFYKHSIDSSSPNSTGSMETAADWYLKGSSCANLSDDNAKNGLYASFFGNADCVSYKEICYNGLPGSEFTSAMQAEALAEALGYTKDGTGAYQQQEVGKLAYLQLSNFSNSHAVTCYGLETDDSGNLSAIYIANTDDSYYGLKKLYCDSFGYLFSDEEHKVVWGDTDWKLQGVSSIVTPESLKKLYNEYNNADKALVWTGDAANGRLVAGTTAGAAELPNDTTGWAISAGDTLYNAFYDAERRLRFDDTASMRTVLLGEDMQLAGLELANGQDYVFQKDDGSKIRSKSLSKSGNGKVLLDGIELSVSENLQTTGGSMEFQNGAKLVLASSNNSSSDTQLINAQVVNKGSGCLTESNANSTFCKLEAQEGDIILLNKGNILNLEELALAEGRSLSAFKGAEQLLESASEACISLGSGSKASFAAGSSLNANLKLEGASLQLAESGFHMGSTLTLGSGNSLSNLDGGSWLEGLAVGESRVLATGVDSLLLGTQAQSFGEQLADASLYFSNLSAAEGNVYYLNYLADNGGSVSISYMAMPEPSGCTLALLGLGALALRRRRR